MTDDPIVEEVRKARKELAASLGNDLVKIVSALQERERISSRPVLNPGPQWLAKKPPADQSLNSTDPSAGSE